jgi:tetratricopeptide (TPR) repeat protein
MAENIAYQKAMVLFERALRFQMRGDLSDAIFLYEHSIDVHPTPEAYTFLGWAVSMMSRYEEAIEYCEQAIALDPSYGNPYNDIGAYLIELDRVEEALPWLEKATVAERYDTPQLAFLNLGRAYQMLGQYRSALSCFDDALEIDPLYMPAINSKRVLLGRLN